ncbi:MAG TPA: histidine kinase dimerization/phospho-acceptor domain-containing protein [Croceibacterium sp.]|nr:histidine kinase dimerization/phospho-acceptor domain-containing protein [Croceibacterium sp.]
MLFDDRLATVLRSPAQSEAGARTQYRQLLDLLGSMPADASGALIEAAYERLGELAAALPATVQSAILRAPGLRLRNRALVGWLAGGEPQAAAAAMATAQLAESDWLHLIPRLEMSARGFLRHRRDLPFSARQVLERLGVQDLVLPEPAPGSAVPAPAAPEPPQPAEADSGIGALVRRIEAFQRARKEGVAPSRLPLGDVRDFAPEPRGRAFDFASDAEGAVTWADPAMAPLVVGLRLGPQRPGAPSSLDAAGAAALARRLPLRGARATLAGPLEIAGEWRIDAAPVFAPGTGHFAGYHGRMRRPLARRAGAASPAGDRMRQLIHELRTPVGAIQGFAELIQQQLFGPAPNEYRALAAAVAVDAARLLAGFDELDRLARLETGALRLGEGRCDWREVVGQIIRRLEGVLRPRSARIDLAASGGPFTVPLDEAEALQLAWRLLATLAGALAPGEVAELALASDGERVTLAADLPAAFLGDGDVFAATAPAQPRAVSAGMFGTGFSLRLARAEAASVGGGLERVGDALHLVLPVLTGPAADHTLRSGEPGGKRA